MRDPPGSKQPGFSLARRNRAVRSVGEYLAKAAEFDGLAASASKPTLKKRYADMAECYRLLASERQRLVETGAVKNR
jgi:hypothetical protein